MLEAILSSCDPNTHRDYMKEVSSMPLISRALDNWEYLVIIRDNFCIHENVGCDLDFVPSY